MSLLGGEREAYSLTQIVNLCETGWSVPSVYLGSAAWAGSCYLRNSDKGCPCWGWSQIPLATHRVAQLFLVKGYAQS